MTRLALLFALAAPAAALAQPGSSGSSVSEPDRVVCRRDPEAGTRVRSRRICMTRREWNLLAGQARDAMAEDIRRRNGVCNGGACQ